MNYEKKYKEAIERMKSWARGEHPECFSEAQKAAEFVFPELKNKDEEIRKALIEMVHDTTGDELWVDYNVHKEEALAWLEKQGEQNFTDNKEKLDLLNFIRKETGCGLAEANNALLKLNKVLKQHPVPIMDKPRKLKIEWEE